MFEDYINNSSSMRNGNGEVLSVLKKFVDVENPPFKVVQIAGTNGKGTTAALIADYLNHLSVDVGLFTSPHLEKLNERIIVNGYKISDKDFRVLYNKYPLSEFENSLTYFEKLFIVAILYFIDKKVDYVVLETGLGGRLDATTLLNKELAIITKIDYDHIELLGNSLEKIAAEKGYIAKNAKNLIYLPQSDIVDSTLESFINDDNIVSFKKYFDNVNLNAFQQNFNIFYTSILFFVEHYGLDLDENYIKKMELFRLKGRVDVIHNSNGTDIVLDVSHNVNGIDNLVSFIKNEYGYGFNVLYSSLDDKDYKTILEKLKEIGKKFYFYRIESKERNRKTDQGLFDYALQLGLDFVEIKSIEDVTEILRLDDFLICGSFVVVGDAYKILIGKV